MCLLWSSEGYLVFVKNFLLFVHIIFINCHAWSLPKATPSAGLIRHASMCLPQPMTSLVTSSVEPLRLILFVGRRLRFDRQYKCTQRRLQRRTSKLCWPELLLIVHVLEPLEDGVCMLIWLKQISSYEWNRKSVHGIIKVSGTYRWWGSVNISRDSIDWLVKTIWTIEITSSGCTAITGFSITLAGIIIFFFFFVSIHMNWCHIMSVSIANRCAGNIRTNRRTVLWHTDLLTRKDEKNPPGNYQFTIPLDFLIH